MKYCFVIIVLTLCFSAYASSASDIIHLLDKIYGTELDQLDSLNDLNDIESLVADLSEQQLDNLIQQLEAITGHSGYGDIFNSAEDKKNQEWSPSTWDSALKGESGTTESRYQSLLTSYQQTHPALSPEEMALGASEAYTNDYQQVVAVNQAANVQATYEFNDINLHLETIQSLVDQIEQADDEKGIADLNARINAETAYLTVEAIKMLTLLNQQYAQEVASELVDRQLASKLNQIPTE